MIDHKTRYFFGEAFRLWWAFISAGIFTLMNPYLIDTDVANTRFIIFGFVAVFIGIVLKTVIFGLQSDTSTNRIRNCSAIFGLKKGIWQPIPNFQKIIVTSKKVSTWNAPNGNSPTFKNNSTIYNSPVFEFRKFQIFPPKQKH